MVTRRESFYQPDPELADLIAEAEGRHVDRLDELDAAHRAGLLFDLVGTVPTFEEQADRLRRAE